MVDQSIPETDQTRLEELLQQLSQKQIEYVIARLDCDTDKEAAAKVRLTDSAVKRWNTDGKKRLVDEAVKLMHVDGVITALHLRRRNLARAMAVKVAGLESRDERVRQSCATELIEWQLGKAEQTNRVEGKVELLWLPHKPPD